MCNDDWGLETRGLCRRFGTTEALRSVDLRVRRGSLVALVGSNGAGKTTLIKILATLLSPTSGTARILGQDVASRAVDCRRNLGYAPADERSFHGRLTVMQNLECFGALQGVGARDVRTRSQGLLEQVGLAQKLGTRFSDLSSGMKQSLSLVRALLHDPPVLLLDEPTRSLSPDLALRVGELLHRLATDRGRTILLATHNLGEADALAGEVAILHGGRIAVQGAPADLCRANQLPGLPGTEAVFRHFTGQPAHAEAP
jgi:ABC-2 type transport system ATP-binding protein